MIVAYKKIYIFLEEGLLQGLITADIFHFLVDTKPLIPTVFGIPKIHRDIKTPPYRLIVDAHNSKTYSLVVFCGLCVKGC